MHFRYWTLLLTIFFSCKKTDRQTEPLPEISDIPEIALIQVNKNQVRAFNDSIVFTIEYTDGNGDIGWDIADSLSFFVTDTRIPITEKYFIPNVAPMNAEITVRGVFDIVLDHTILVGSGANEQVIFELQMKDRAGNISNTIICPAITVTM